MVAATYSSRQIGLGKQRSGCRVCFERRNRTFDQITENQTTIAVKTDSSGALHSTLHYKCHFDCFFKHCLDSYYNFFKDQSSRKIRYAVYKTEKLFCFIWLFININTFFDPNTGKLTTLNSSAVNCEVYLTPAKILDESMLTACQSFEHPDIASLAPIQQIADLESSTLLPTIEVKSERLPLTDSNQLNFSTAAPILPLLKKKPTQPDMLDHITYDPTLPDEILQGESNTGDNLISSFPSSTMTTQHQIQSTNHHSHPHHDHHRSDTIIYSQHLPDDIFDAEQDTNAVSAPLSSLASSLLHPASSDTNPSSNVQQLTLDSICQLISKETDLTKSALTVNGNITSNPIAPISPGARRQAKKSKPSRGEKTIEMLNAKRRKVWTSIARKDIPKAQKQKVNQKREMLISCRKMAVMCMRDRKQLVLATRQQRHCSDQPPATGHCKIDSTPSPDPIDSIYSDSHPLEVILTEDGVNVEPHADLFAIAPPPSSSDHILRPYASSSSTFASACASSPSLSSSSSSSTSSSAILVTSLIMPDSNRFDLASGRAS